MWLRIMKTASTFSMQMTMQKQETRIGKTYYFEMKIVFCDDFIRFFFVFLFHLVELLSLENTWNNQVENNYNIIAKLFSSKQRNRRMKNQLRFYPKFAHFWRMK